MTAVNSLILHRLRYQVQVWSQRLEVFEITFTRMKKYEKQN